MAIETNIRKAILPRPDPNKVHLAALKNIRPETIRDLQDYVGPTAAIFLNGSHANGTAAPDSIRDAIILTNDPREFHRRNIKHHSRMYGLPHNPLYHAAWDHLGLTYYRTKINRRTKSSWKLAVLGTETFFRMGYGGFHQGVKVEPSNPFELAVQGRFQKKALASAGEVSDDIKAVIDQTRLIGMIQVLGFLPKTFSLDQAEDTYIGWSYKTDVRVEQPDKVKKIKNADKSGYDEMISGLLERLESVDIVEQIGDREYRSLFTPNKRALNRLVWEARGAAVLSNYIKNPAASGLFGCLEYALDKLFRAGKRQWEVISEEHPFQLDWSQYLPKAA